MNVKEYKELTRKYEDSEEFTLLLTVNPLINRLYQENHNDVLVFYTAIRQAMPAEVANCPVMCGGLLLQMCANPEHAGTIMGEALVPWAKLRDSR